MKMKGLPRLSGGTLSLGWDASSAISLEQLDERDRTSPPKLMRLVLHPKVYSDIDTIMAYYEQVAAAELANEFYGELRAFHDR